MGIFFGILSAVFDAFKNIQGKKNTLSSGSLLVTWGSSVFSALVLLPFMFAQGKPELDNIFWAALIARTVLDTASTLLFFYSIKKTDLSLCLPLLSFVPLSLLVFGIVLNKEVPNIFGVLGVVSIIFGVYLLHYKKGDNLADPVISIIKDKGSFAMFWVAIIWGLSSALNKTGISHSNPFFYGGISSIFLALGVTMVVVAIERKNFVSYIKTSHFIKLAPVGVFDGLAYISQMIGQSMTLSFFVISLKRTSVLISSVLGWYFFKEPIKGRLLSILLIIFGIFLIVFST